MSTLSITIQDWAAWVPGISTRADWQQWQQGSKTVEPGAKPDLVQVPAMLRRRLSTVGKMALSVAWSVVPNEDTKLPAVFASRHGELKRTVGMLQTLATNNVSTPAQLSPTQFSLSVHNAISGVYSIARKDVNAITALAVGEEGINLALMEAELIRQERGADAILCVIYDEPLTEPFSEKDAGPTLPYALAVKIGSTTPADGLETMSLALSLEEKATAADGENEPQVLSFIRYMLSPNQRVLQLPGHQHSWCWNKLNDVQQSEAS